MEKTLFRKESLERISSPEQMRDYMRVTGPRLWMLLAAIAALLAGFLVYASTTRMETTVTLPVTVGDDGTMIAELTETQAEQVKIGMGVRIGGKEARVVETLRMLDAEEDSIGMVLIELTEEGKLPEGLYQAEIVTESVSPIDFLIN